MLNPCGSCEKRLCHKNSRPENETTFGALVVSLVWCKEIRLYIVRLQYIDLLYCSILYNCGGLKRNNKKTEHGTII